MANDFIVDMDIVNLYPEHHFSEESQNIVVKMLKSRNSVNTEGFVYHYDLEGVRIRIRVREDQVNIDVHNLIRGLLT